MNRKEIIKLCNHAEFQQVGFFESRALKFLPEVREMCAANRCNHYGKSWMCPPACGSLEEITIRASNYSSGLLVQSTATMRDEFDLETMDAVGKSHQQKFLKLVTMLHDSGLSFLPMGAGTCNLCADCTFPKSPCRFPELAYPSMEAYGLVVTDVCLAADIPYYYGVRTITFSSCILWK